MLHELHKHALALHSTNPKLTQNKANTQPKVVHEQHKDALDAQEMVVVRKNLYVHLMVHVLCTP